MDNSESMAYKLVTMNPNSRVEQFVKFTERLSAESVIRLLLSLSSTERAEAVKLWAQTLDTDDGDKFWEVIGAEWATFDLIDHFAFEQLFEKFWDTHPGIEEPEKFNSIEVFRGQCGDEPSGLSFTTDRDIAEGFSIGHRGITNIEPTVISLIIEVDDIALVFSERGESEIVLRRIPF